MGTIPKLEIKEVAKQTGKDKKNMRWRNLLTKTTAFRILQGKKDKTVIMEKPAMSNGGTKKIEKETVSKEEKVKVVAETIPKLEIKEVAKQTGKDKKNMR